MSLTVAIVGAGRVGCGLGRRLRELGWRIGAVVARSRARARRAVLAIGGGVAHGALTRQAVGGDVILITTPDDAIARVAEELAGIGGSEWRGKIVLHTSGALDRGALEPLSKLGASTGSIHPLQTFSGRGVPDLDGVVFAIEGDRRALRTARNIARSLGGVPVVVEGPLKPAYHAAGAMVAGQGLALVEAATRVLMKSGFARRQAVQALLPLMRQMLSNFERHGPRAAWTGPHSRGDYATIARHHAALTRFPREFGGAYRALTLLASRLLAANPAADERALECASKDFQGGRV
jgi:predicted short-subunit dehydrogenase-like oxidoreductase (DUF2520 family)